MRRLCVVRSEGDPQPAAATKLYIQKRIGMTMDQLKKVFTGQCSNWKEVGGNDAPIMFITMPPESGMRSFLSKDVIKADFSPSALEIKSIGQILSMVRGRPAAITYCRTDLALDAERSGALKCLGLKLTPESAPVQLTEETVTKGAFPISRALSLHYDGRSGSQVARYFAEFCASKAKEKGLQAKAALAAKEQEK